MLPPRDKTNSDAARIFCNPRLGNFACQERLEIGLNLDLGRIGLR